MNIEIKTVELKGHMIGDIAKESLILVAWRTALQARWKEVPSIFDQFLPHDRE